MGWWLGAKQFIKDCDEAEKLAREAQRQYNLIINGVGKMGIICYNPTENLRIYYDDKEKGNWYTGEAYVIAPAHGYHLVKGDEIKMTREEAYIKLVQNVNTGNFTEGGLKGLISAFEALGLIKFDEPENLTPTMYSMIPHKIYQRHIAAIEEIEKAGYKIVKA